MPRVSCDQCSLVIASCIYWLFPALGPLAQVEGHVSSSLPSKMDGAHLLTNLGRRLHKARLSTASQPSNLQNAALGDEAQSDGTEVTVQGLKLFDEGMKKFLPTPSNILMHMRYVFTEGELLGRLTHSGITGL